MFYPLKNKYSRNQTNCCLNKTFLIIRNIKKNIIKKYISYYHHFFNLIFIFLYFYFIQAVKTQAPPIPLILLSAVFEKNLALITTGIFGILPFPKTLKYPDFSAFITGILSYFLFLLKINYKKLLLLFLSNIIKIISS